MLFLIIANSAVAQTNYTTISDGSWSSSSTWDANGIPPDPLPAADSIFIQNDVTVTSSIEILGVITIEASHTLTATNQFDVGRGSVNEGEMINYGTVVASTLEVEPDNGCSSSDALPLIHNYGSMSVSNDLDIGKGCGGGSFINALGAKLTVDGELHIDGYLCNQDTIYVNNSVVNHGGTIDCCGYIETSSVEAKPNSGRPGTFGCTDICSSGGSEPSLQVDGSSYTDFNDAYFNSSTADAVFDNDSTHFCGQDQAGRTSVNYPGGVYDKIQLWLKANDGVKNSGSDASDGQAVNSWEDRSGERMNDATDENLSSPTYRHNDSDNINFNPVVEFDGNDDGLDYADDYIYSSGSGDEDGMTWFCVVKPDDASSLKQRQFLFDFGLFNNKGYGLMYGDEHYECYTSTDDGGVDSGILSHSNDTEAVITTFAIDFNDDQSLSINGASAITSNSISLSALSSGEIDENDEHDTDKGPFTVGRQSKDHNLSSQNGRMFDGKIAEIVGYNKVLSTTEKQKVQSYLAIKYGITLSHDYFDSQGSLLHSIESDFGYGLAAIGRDDLSGLNQSKSRSSKDIVGFNSTSLLEDGEYAFLSSNGKSMETLTPSNSFGLMLTQRIWKVDTKPNFMDLEIVSNSKLNFDCIVYSESVDFRNYTVVPLNEHNIANLQVNGSVYFRMARYPAISGQN